MATTIAQPKKKVILDHDGGIDDLVALAILAAFHEQFDLIGVICIDADCFIDPAVEVSGKLLAAMQHYGRIKAGGDAATNPFESLGAVPIGRSTLTAVHEFPREWRADAIKMNDLPCVNTPAVLAQWEANKRHEVYCTANEGAGEEKKHVAGEELLAELVMKKGSPTDKVTICVTGPLSNIGYCIAKYGKAFTDNIEDIVVMGGAVDVEGNVFESTTEKRGHSFAEWNIYWDAPAAKVALECPHVRNVLFALDATNHVPVNSAFVKRFGEQKEGSFLSEFIGSSWAMCAFFEIVYGQEHAYYAWDALTAAWCARPSIAEGLEKVPIRVVVASDPEVGIKQEGRTQRLTAEEAAAAGNASNVLLPTKVHSAEFYDMMLEVAARV